MIAAGERAMRRAAGQLPGGESSRTLAWAGMGGALWLLLLPVSLDSPAESGLIVRWLLLAILVLCPLGLHLAATPDRLGQPARPYRLAVLTHPAAALLAVVSLLLAPGPLAGLLALPWLGWTLLVAGFGFWRLLPRGFVRADEACIDLGLIYLAVGGFWLLVWRLGLSLFGFGPTVAALTAVHFHVAGLVALVLAGLAGRALAATASDAERWYRPVALAVMVGPPLIALGITFSFAVELLATLVFSAGLGGLALLQVLELVPNRQQRVAQALLVVSCGAVAAAMLFALGYGLARLTGWFQFSIAQMAAVHGTLNALGFALCGLLAWTLEPPASQLAAPGVPFSRLRGSGRIGPDFFAASGAVPAAVERPPLGLVDELGEYRRADFDPARVHPAIRRFYERTGQHELLVRARWHAGFRLLAPLYARWSRSVGQMCFPTGLVQDGERIASRILPLDAERDGRPGARAWVRTYADGGTAIYVAAYATHRSEGVAYMNIAFPLPGANLASVLRPDLLEAGRGMRGLLLTTRGAGDQGVYLVTPRLPIRLPLDETILVWAAGMPGAPEWTGDLDATVLARHDVWLFGLPLLTLEYAIAPLPDAASALGSS